MPVARHCPSSRILQLGVLNIALSKWRCCPPYLRPLFMGCAPLLTKHRRSCSPHSRPLLPGSSPPQACAPSIPKGLLMAVFPGVSAWSGRALGSHVVCVWIGSLRA